MRKANAYCSDLGLRLPTIDELVSMYRSNSTSMTTYIYSATDCIAGVDGCVAANSDARFYSGGIVYIMSPNGTVSIAGTENHLTVICVPN